MKMRTMRRTIRQLDERGCLDQVSDAGCFRLETVETVEKHEHLITVVVDVVIVNAKGYNYGCKIDGFYSCSVRGLD